MILLSVISFADMFSSLWLGFPSLWYYLLQRRAFLILIIPLPFITFLFQVCLLNVLCRQVFKIVNPQSLCPLTGYFFLVCIYHGYISTSLYFYHIILYLINYLILFYPLFTKFSFSLLKNLFSLLTWKIYISICFKISFMYLY